VASYLHGAWLSGAHGTIPNDFVDVSAAGQLVLQGNPAAVYDWPTHKAMEVIALGHAFDGYFGWHYPPTYLPVAALLARMASIPAQNIFLFSTFCAYIFCLHRIIGEHFGFLLASYTSQAFLANGWADFAKLQTAFGKASRRPSTRARLSC